MRIRLTGTSSTLPDSVRGTSPRRPPRRGRGAASSPRGCARGSARRGRRRAPRRRAARRTAASSPDVDDERVDDLVERQHGAVDLARAHADAAAVDRRVPAAGDDRRAALGDLDPVAVAPDAGVHLEVGLAVALAVGVVPEVQRHRRHRLGDHELADLADQRPALGVPRLDRRAQRARLQLALVDGQDRHAADERRADVGAAARREQPRVRADLLVDPAEALGRERRAGRADGAQRARGRGPRRAPRPPSCTRRCRRRWCRSTSCRRASARSHSTPMSGWPGLPS